MPLFAPSSFAAAGLLDKEAVPVLHEIRHHNPLLFDFVLKRHLHAGTQRLPDNIFHTRNFFDTRDFPNRRTT